MTMETIIFLPNHMLTYCITVDLGKIVLKCKYRVRIEQIFDRKSLLHLHRTLMGKSTGTTQ